MVPNEFEWVQLPFLFILFWGHISEFPGHYSGSIDYTWCCWELVWGARDWTCIGCMQDKCFTCFNFSLLLLIDFFGREVYVVCESGAWMSKSSNPRVILTEIRFLLFILFFNVQYSWLVDKTQNLPRYICFVQCLITSVVDWENG